MPIHGGQLKYRAVSSAILGNTNTHYDQTAHKLGKLMAEALTVTKASTDDGIRS